MILWHPFKGRGIPSGCHFLTNIYFFQLNQKNPDSCWYSRFEISPQVKIHGSQIRAVRRPVYVTPISRWEKHLALDLLRGSEFYTYNCWIVLFEQKRSIATKSSGSLHSFGTPNRIELLNSNLQCSTEVALLVSDLIYLNIKNKPLNIRKIDKIIYRYTNISSFVYSQMNYNYSLLFTAFI